MIRYIRGKIFHTDSDHIIVENSSGVGFDIQIPMGSAFYTMVDGEEAKVYTSMIVREDDISLYGFTGKEGLELFELLITVNGIGAKAALAIMGTLSESELKVAIATNDVKALTKANGVGKKIAERLILELKDKIGDITALDVPVLDALIPAASGEKGEAAEALMSLGYTRNEALAALEKVQGENLTCEQYIMNALKNL